VQIRLRAGVEHVEVDIPTMVLVGEGVTSFSAITSERLVQGAIPGLGIGHGQGSAIELCRA